MAGLNNKQVGWVKAVVFVLSLVPFAQLVWGTASGGFSDPLAAITAGSGEWALYFLCITLAMTPLRRLTGWNWLVKLRRMVGLFTFFYALVHFTAFLWFDHFFDVPAMLVDVVKRPFILVGFIAFVLLIPLAATSTNAMIKRLGGKRWQWIHRLIYVIAPLAILHFWWMKEGKNDFLEPIIFGSIVAVLLAWRLWWHFRPKPQPVRA
jgi:sulfoxide reductase heme-binding subunit YedZ